VAGEYCKRAASDDQSQGVLAQRKLPFANMDGPSAHRPHACKNQPSPPSPSPLAPARTLGAREARESAADSSNRGRCGDAAGGRSAREPFSRGGGHAAAAWQANARVFSLAFRNTPVGNGGGGCFDDGYPHNIYKLRIFRFTR
jgi:hypothetical protein